MACPLTLGGTRGITPSPTALGDTWHAHSHLVAHVASPPHRTALGDTWHALSTHRYSAALSWQQTDDLFTYFMYANDTRMVTRPTTLACAGYNNKCSTYTAYGMAYGLLSHDMVSQRPPKQRPCRVLQAPTKPTAMSRCPTC